MTETFGRRCAVCQADSVGGRTYQIYYGNLTGTTQSAQSTNVVKITSNYQIIGSEDVFVCSTCLLNPRLKGYKISLIILIVIGILGVWTVIVPLWCIPSAIYIYKIWNERKKAIAGADKEMQTKYLEKERVYLDTVGFPLAKKALIGQMKSRGQNFDAFFTPTEFSALKSPGQVSRENSYLTYNCPYCGKRTLYSQREVFYCDNHSCPHGQNPISITEIFK